MRAIVTPYLHVIVQALLFFPVAAAVFTIPFMVVNYRKYGGIALMRVIVVYSFILYSMCAFLLTVLPLPTREAVAAMTPRPIGWVPLTDLSVALGRAGFAPDRMETWTDPALWATLLRSRDFFQIVANIVMQIPLGFYLRYYFRFSFRKTVLIGLLVSLFYELTQLSGLFFIYPHAYRYASVDDLINNTLGAALGYAVTPVLALILPTREQIDAISYSKGEHLTLIRRMLAAVLDVMLLLAIWTSGAFLPLPTWLNKGLAWCLFPAYFALIPYLMGGRTPGQALLRIRVVQTGGGKPGLWQLLVRNLLLYVGEPLLALFAMTMLLGLVITLTAEGLELPVLLLLTFFCTAGLLAVVWFFLHSLLRWNTFPHGRFSRTTVVQSGEIRRLRERPGKKV